MSERWNLPSRRSSVVPPLAAPTSLSDGKRFAGILKDDFVVRVGPENNDVALKEPHTRPMDFTGKPMKGYVYVSSSGTKTAGQLRAWLNKGLDFVAGLPPKKQTPKRPRPTR